MIFFLILGLAYSSDPLPSCQDCLDWIEACVVEELSKQDSNLDHCINIGEDCIKLAKCEEKK